MKKRKKTLFSTKKGFSLVELLVAIGILSFVVLSFYKVKNNNLYLIEKTDSSKKNNDHIILAIDIANKTKNNRNIYLDKHFNIKDDDIRREFKEFKINTKYETIKKYQYKASSLILKIEEFKTTYSLEDAISKDIYRFELQL